MNETLLSIIIAAKNEASAAIGEVSASLDELAAQSDLANAKTASLSKSFDDAGKSLSKTASAFMPFSLAAGAALGVAAYAAVNFQQKMELLHTQAGLTQSTVDGLNQQLLDMAPAVGAGPDALATAFYHIASAGNGIWSTAQMLDILKVSAEGAAIGQANLDDTTYALTSALASNVKGAKDASEMMAVLNAIVGSGDMHMQDLNGAIGTGFLSTAAAFGISIQSVGAALATLTDNGEHADAAATRLRMTWALMGSPSGEATKQLSALGLTTDEVSTATGTMNEVFAKSGLTTTKLADDLRQPNGMTVAIQDLQTHLEDAGLTASQTDAMLAKAFGGGRTDAALLTLLQNIDRMNAKYQAINDQTSQFQSDWAAQQATVNQQLKDFWAQLQVLAVELGTAFLPTLIGVGSALSGVVKGLTDMSPWMRQAIVDTLLVTATLGPLLLMAGKVATAIGAISKVGSVFGGLGAAAGGLESAAGASAGIAGMGAIMSAAAPFAVALAPILGVVAYGMHQQAQAASEDAKATADASKEIKDFGASQTLTQIFTNAHTTAVNNQKQATTDLSKATDANKTSSQNLTGANKDLEQAQKDVTKALQTYGQNSPQYQAATQALTQKQQDYRDAVHDASNKTLDLMVAQGKLKDANKILADATASLNGWLKDQNKSLGDITNTIAQMGPTADLQVKAIANLGQNIANVVTVFRNAQGELQAGIASDIGNFQGLGSTIDRLQNAAGNLQKTAGGIQIQGGSAGSLQGNYGTAPVKHADGGVFSTPHWALFAEDGPEAIIPLNNPNRAQQVMKEAGLGGSQAPSLSVGNVDIKITGPFMGTSSEARQFASQMWQQFMTISKSNGMAGNLPAIGIRPL